MQIPWWAVLLAKFSDPVTGVIGFVLGLFARAWWHTFLIAVVVLALTEGLLFFLRGERTVELSFGYLAASYFVSFSYVFAGFAAWLLVGRAGRRPTGPDGGAVNLRRSRGRATWVAVAVIVCLAVAVVAGGWYFSGQRYPFSGAGEVANGPATQAESSFIATPSSDSLLAGDLLEVPVYTQDKEQVGRVRDMMIQDGRVLGVVIGVGGVGGVAERDVIIPFEQTVVGARNRTYGGRAAGGAGAARKPRTYVEDRDDPTAFSPDTTTGQGRIMADHLVLRGLSRSALEQAPEWTGGGATE